MWHMGGCGYFCERNACPRRCNMSVHLRTGANINLDSERTQRKIGGKLPLFSARPRVERPALRLWQLCAISMSLPLKTCLRATRIRGVSCLHVKCLPARRFCKTAAQYTQNGPPQAEFREAEDRSINGMRAVAFVAVLSFTLAPGKAQAWGHDWKPRRHHRRMTDSRAAFDLKSVFQVPFPAPRMHCQTYLSCSFLFEHTSAQTAVTTNTVHMCTQLQADKVKEKLETGSQQLQQQVRQQVHT